MATSVAEVVVSAVPEGISDTTGQLEQMESTVQESTDSMQEQAGTMSDLSESFKGAMGAAVAGLAVAAGGLLSQVPVLGEAFAGLNAVVDAIAFQMDKVLRPVLTPLTNGFFKVAEAIFEADGVVGTIIGTLASVVTAIVAIGGPIALAAGKIFGFAAVWGAIKTAVATAVGAIVSVIGGIPAAIAGLIIAIAAFAVGYLTNWKGIRDKTDAIVGEIISFVTDGFTTLANGALEILTDFVGFAIDRFMAFLDFLTDFGADIATAATGIGANIVNGIIEGIKGLTGILLDVVTSVINSVIGLINSAIEVIPDRVKENLGLEQLDTISTSDFSAPSITQQQARSRTNTQPFDFIGSRATSESNTYIDGRRVNDNQGRYRKDALNRRG